MAATAEELYKQREQRFNDVVALKKPDRVPVVPLAMNYFADLWKGHSIKEAGSNHRQHYAAMRDATVEFGWDMAPMNGLFAVQGYEALGTTQLRWPGGELPDNVGFQFVEDEYLQANEYDEFLADPDGFTLRKIFPRIASNLEGFGQVPFPPLHFLSSTYYLLNVGGPILGAPPLRQALEALLAMSDAVGEYFAADAAQGEELAALGHPRAVAAPITPPFDIVASYLRSLRGSTVDMFRRPDQLLSAIDLYEKAQIALALMSMQVTGNPRVFIPALRGAGGFMSDEQFETFYWPSFKNLVLAIIDAGGVPCPLLEGDYTPRLKYLAELPVGKIAAHFDRVDLNAFKEMLSDRMCFWGNVSMSTICTGRPEQVKEEVRELCELFGDTGALVLDSRTGIPDEAKPENVMAMREAADEFGVW